MKTLQKTNLRLNGKEVPVKIYRELRNNVRASIGKKAVILRMPLQLSARQQEEQLKWFTDWVKHQFKGDTGLQLRFFGKDYQNGDKLKVGRKTYLLQIEYTNNRTHQASLKKGIIYLQLSKGDAPAHLQKAIKHLLSRVIGQDFMPEIHRRVMQLNRRYFKKEIRSINLKYNQSNWGSCSSKGNVNLSTRLLFAPDEVINYVIIHELAHLIELNHSSRFWKLVAEAMPDYKEKEIWLKEYGHLCQF